MKYRTKSIALLIAAGALLVILVLGLLVQNVQRGRTAETPLFAQGLDPTKASGITISHGSSSIVLLKVGDHWTLNASGDSIPVKDQRVDDFLRSLPTLSILRTASTTQSSLAELKIDDAEAYRLSLTVPGRNVDFLFGDTAGDEQYVREGTSNTVWAIRSGTATFLQEDAKYWADKSVWPDDLQQENIVSVDYSGASGTHATFTKSTSKDQAETWTISGKTKMKTDGVAAYVSSVATLEGDDTLLVDAGAPPAGYKASFTLTVKTAAKTYKADVYQGTSKDDPFLVVPDFDGKRVSKNGKVVGILCPDYKVQKSSIE